MKLLIVSGMSGAGKSLTLNALEELGFFCVDNLPSSMLGDFVALCEGAKPPIVNAAATVDSREALLSGSPAAMVKAIRDVPVPYDILFLDARDDVLRNRYNETRRRHPLGDSGDAESGIKRERLYLQDMRDMSSFILDTSELKPRQLSSAIHRFIPETGVEEVSLVVSSFGYKRGVPVDADIILDMRFCDNPFYHAELRQLSGLDKPVRDFVLGEPYVAEYLKAQCEIIANTVPLFDKQDKHLIRVCFGCTGGRHRSVVAAEQLFTMLKERGFRARVYHRDLRLEAQDISERFPTT